MKKALAFDIGGTKIYSAVIDETGKIVLTKEVEVVDNNLGQYYVMNFTEVKKEGLYLCQIKEILVWSKPGCSPGSLYLPALVSSAGMSSSSWWREGCCTSRPCIPGRKKGE